MYVLCSRHNNFGVKRYFELIIKMPSARPWKGWEMPDYEIKIALFCVFRWCTLGAKNNYCSSENKTMNIKREICVTHMEVYFQWYWIFIDCTRRANGNNVEPTSTLWRKRLFYILKRVSVFNAIKENLFKKSSTNLKTTVDGKERITTKITKASGPNCRVYRNVITRIRIL